jgi:hypothetical protein
MTPWGLAPPGAGAEHPRGGEPVTDRTPTRIEVPFPAVEGPLTLRIAVGACRLRIAPGGERWLEGTHDDGAGAIPHTIALEGGTLRLAQRVELARTLDLLSGGAPSFDLTVGAARPFALELDSGASDCVVDLGGVPLTRLQIRQAAGRLRVDFSRPCPEGLGELRVDAGATSLELANLANAAFSELRVQGGAARCDLRFGGALRRDARAAVEVGVASVRIAVPASTAARVEARSIVGGLRIGDGFTKREGTFWTEAAVAGRTPVLGIRAETSVGMLEIAVE